MLGGMRALPGGDWADDPAPESGPAGSGPAGSGPAGSGIVRVDHGFTHFDLTLTLVRRKAPPERSEEHTSELQSLMRTSYAVFCLNKTTQPQSSQRRPTHTIY